MTQPVMIKNSVQPEAVCATCKHFVESEGMLYCKFYDAFFNAETFFIPCEFKEEPDVHFLNSSDDF